METAIEPLPIWLPTCHSLAPDRRNKIVSSAPPVGIAGAVTVIRASAVPSLARYVVSLANVGALGVLGGVRSTEPAVTPVAIACARFEKPLTFSRKS